jgi:hypothetical protein
VGQIKDLFYRIILTQTNIFFEALQKSIKTTCARQKIAVIGFIFLLMICHANSVSAAGRDAGKRFDIELEAGPVWQSKNDVRIPGDGGDRYSFKELTGNGPYIAGRLSIGWDIRELHGLKFVVAPLRVSGSGTFNRPVSFAGSTFAPDKSTNGSYKFDTYRLTYRYLFVNKSTWRLRAGGTMLLRDAEIELQQNGVKASDSNVGGVPLVSLAVEWSFLDRWVAILDFDGLAGGPGRAFDTAVKFQYDWTDRWRFGVGYRTLEGGVDNDTVYNFAWFHYAFISIGYQF